MFGAYLSGTWNNQKKRPHLGGEGEEGEEEQHAHEVAVRVARCCSRLRIAFTLLQDSDAFASVFRDRSSEDRKYFGRYESIFLSDLEGLAVIYLSI